jgi:hypothetical protein
MGVVTIAEAWPTVSRPFTADVPDVDKPELIVFELRDGRYEQVAHVAGDEVFAAIRPFPVEVIPSQLVAGLLPG